MEHEERTAETERDETPETNLGISPHDLPVDHEGREEAEELGGGEDGTTSGNL